MNVINLINFRKPCCQLAVENINTKIALKLKELRIAAGYSSYEKFAIENDLARKYYWMTESGKSKVTIEYLSKVLEKHKIKLSDFFFLLEE